MRKRYKYALSITSQLSFCSVPIRLDPYNRCQFGCGYCFASTRQGHGRTGPLQVSDSKILRARLLRVDRGDLNSALDEFIQRRIPFQLGGMADPFSGIERREKKTLGFLRVLKEFDYPFIVSTKGTLPSTPEYLDLIRGANVYVRFSTTVVSEKLKRSVDVGCPSIGDIAKSAEALTRAGVPVAFRFQPIIPGYESDAFRLIDLAASIGVKHISAEYLKVPIDADLKFGRGLISILGERPIERYISIGARKLGREYSLPLTYREQYLPEMYQYAKSKNISFGFADNDLLLHSDGSSCCSASNLYLKRAGFFTANIVSVAKQKRHGDLILFNDFYQEWMPKKPVATYLNSAARIPARESGTSDWHRYLERMWVGDYGVYSPGFFDGIEKSTQCDRSGLPIYMRSKSSFETLLRDVRSDLRLRDKTAECLEFGML